MCAYGINASQGRANSLSKGARWTLHTELPSLMECAEDRCRAALQLIDFGGEDEIAFGQPVDLVRPGGDFCLPPGQKNVGVMPLFFGDLAHFVHKLKRLAKIRESKCPGDVMRVHHLP